MRILWLLALSLFLMGADWNISPGQDEPCRLPLKPNVTCFYDFTDTTDPAVIDVSQCDNLDLSLMPSVLDTSTDAEIQVYACLQAGTWSANHCHKILSDTDGDGVINDVTLDGSTLMRRGLAGFTSQWLAVDITTGPSSDTGRVMLQCRG